MLRPEGGAVALAAHRAAFEQRYCPPGADRRRGLDLHVEVRPADCGLRCRGSPIRCFGTYAGPRVSCTNSGLPAHRAGPDAYVTAHHLRDMLNEVSVEQLLSWSKEPGTAAARAGGADARSSVVPSSTMTLYVPFAGDRDIDVRFSAHTELSVRGERAHATDQAGPRQPTLI